MKYPIKLNKSTLAHEEIIIPSDLSLNLRAGLLSSGKMTVPNGKLQLRDLIMIETDAGPGYYRVSSITDTNEKEQSVSFENTIVMLEDIIIPLGPVVTTTTQGTETTTTTEDTTFSGTVAQILFYILQYQTKVAGFAPWTVGTVHPQTELEYVINHQKAMDLLTQLMGDLPDCYMELDQTVYPWRINILNIPVQPVAEGRMGRNIKNVKITYNESDMCTRVYCEQLPEVHDGQGNSLGRYIDSPNIDTYGLSAEYLDFTSDEITDAEALARCQKYLNQRDKPRASIQMDLIDLYSITGEPLDRIKPGTMYRIALPDTGKYINEIVTTLSYPSMVKQSKLARVTLASELQDAAAGMAATARRAQETAEQVVRVVKDQKLSMEDIREVNDTLYHAGIFVDAETGVWAFAKSTPEGAIGQAIMSELRIQADHISTAVGDITSLNGHTLSEVIGSTLYQQKDAITAAVGEMEVRTDEHGVKRLVIKSGGGLKIQRNNVEFGLWDSDNLKAGILIKKINGDGPDDSEILLKASKVDLGDYATVGMLTAQRIEMETAMSESISTGELTVEGTSYLNTVDASSLILNGAALGIQSPTVVTGVAYQQVTVRDASGTLVNVGSVTGVTTAQLAVLGESAQS